MAEITSAGYQSLRDFAISATAVPNQWDYIALYDDSGTEVLRTSITGDSRASWNDVDGDATAKAQITIQGSDGDVSLPTTFEFSAIWDSSSGGRQITSKESMAKATMSQSGDELTVTHTVEIPDV